LHALAERDFENAFPSHGDPLIGGASQSLRQLAAELPQFGIQPTVQSASWQRPAPRGDAYGGLVPPEPDGATSDLEQLVDFFADE
jgi:hypothetical protein